MSLAEANAFAREHGTKRGECIEFDGAKTSKGYGSIRSGNGPPIGAHVLSLELKLGRKLKADEVASHTCDNRPCIKPAHLEAETQSENQSRRFA